LNCSPEIKSLASRLAFDPSFARVINAPSSNCRLIASRYPVSIGGLFYPSTLQHLHQQQQQHQHHSRLAAAASSALSNAVQVAGQSPDIVDADGIRGVLLGGAGWPFPWRPTHSLQTLEHPSPSDVVGTLSRVSPASASFPQRGEFDSSPDPLPASPPGRRVPEQIETAYLG
jgi:hypothetical protein